MTDPLLDISSSTKIIYRNFITYYPTTQNLIPHYTQTFKIFPGAKHVLTTKYEIVMRFHTAGHKMMQ